MARRRHNVDVQQMFGVGAVQTLWTRLISREDLLSALLVSCTIIIGTLLRFYDLGGEGYWYDELIMVRVASEDLGSIFDRVLGGRPPVYVLLAHWFVQIFGISEIATRSLSAIAGSLSIVVMYHVGRELFGWRVGLLGTVFFVLSEFQIYQAQNFRYYSLLVLFTLLANFFYICALKYGTYKYFALYALASILMFYTHTFSLFSMVAPGIYFLLLWKRYHHLWRPWLISHIAIGLGILPGLWIAFLEEAAGTTGVQIWITTQAWWYPLMTLREFLFPLAFYLSPKRLMASAIFFVFGMGVLLFWKGRGPWFASLRTLIPTARQKISEQSTNLVFVLLWLVLTIIIPFTLSQLVSPIYTHRYVIGAAPALYILVGIGLLFMHRIVPLPITFGIFLLLTAPGLRDYYVVDRKEKWHETALYVDEHNQQGDVIMFAPDEDGYLQDFFQIYAQEDTPSCSLHPEGSGTVPLAEEVRQCTAGHERTWLLLRGQEKRTQSFQTFFFDNPGHNMRLLQEEDFNGISLYLFDMPTREAADTAK